jgi:hypothetical protein
MTLSQWKQMSIADQYEKLAYYRARSVTQEWAATSEKRRGRLFNFWRLQQHRKQQQEIDESEES